MINCRKLAFENVAYYRMALGYGELTKLPELLDVLVDFRGNDDALFETSIAKTCVNIPMVGVGQKYRNTKMPNHNDLLEFYIEIVDTYRDGFKQLAGIVEAGSLVGFGCYFGKDRSGIASYLLGKRFGLPFNKILEDYSKSEAALLENIDYLSSHWIKKNVSKQVYATRLKCRNQTILSLDDYINDKYVSVKKYLQE